MKDPKSSHDALGTFVFTMNMTGKGVNGDNDGLRDCPRGRSKLGRPPNPCNYLHHKSLTKSTLLLDC